MLLINQSWRAAGENLVAELLILLNALDFAFFTIFNREFVHKRSYNSQLVSTWVFCGAALWLLPLLVFGAVQPPVGSSSNELGLLVTMALLPTFASYSLLNLGLRHVGAGEASVVLPLNPVSATILSSIFLNEGVVLLSGVDSGLILLSVVFLYMFSRSASH